jgi:hypothetical protein
MARRGIKDVETEVVMPAAYRRKKWDVGLLIDGEPRLAISCKSIIKNHGGTVPNRIDDLLGEAVSLHRAYPKAVLGWLFMMSRRDYSKAALDRIKRKGGETPTLLAAERERGDLWFKRLVESVDIATDRAGPDDFPEKFEAVAYTQVDFDQTPFAFKTPSGGLTRKAFFDRLAELYKNRFGQSV